VKKEIDCQFFEDQLDALLDGSLPDEGIGQLQLHALSCPDCAMLLRVHEHLALPSLEELEAAMPEELVASMWPKVEAGVRAQAKSGPLGVSVDVSAGTSGQIGGRRRSRRIETRETFAEETTGLRRIPWLVPILAAAAIVLLISTGFLFTELRRTKARGVELAEQIGEMERGFAGLNERTAAVERTAGLAGRNRWVRALSMDLGRRESVSIEWVRQRVGRLPPDTPLFTSSEVEALLGGVTSWGFPGFRSEVYDRTGTDGLSAQELLSVFDSLNLDPDNLRGHDFGASEKMRFIEKGEEHASGESEANDEGVGSGFPCHRLFGMCGIHD
jgi:hypothetical protein